MPEVRSTTGSEKWNAEQRRNAAIIIQVGQQMGMSRRDIGIALITAMTESRLVNVNYGDRDSLGLFQQRPSQGWGTPDQVRDPVYASRKFYSTLKGVANRDKMGMGEAAQAVQRSAYPDRYKVFIKDARDFIKGMGGDKIAPSVTRTYGGEMPSALGATATGGPHMVGGSASSALAATTAGGTGAPGLGTPTAGSPATPPLTGLQPFNSPEDYVAMTGGGPFGQKGVDNTQKAIVQYAKQFIGTPYVWGGTDLKNGVDCSGFVQAVYKEMGIDLPRVSYQQANSGKRIGLDGLRPGDLVAWDNSSRNNGADHIAIYAGHGKIIEAPRPGIGVRIRRLGGADDAKAWGVRIK